MKQWKYRIRVSVTENNKSYSLERKRKEWWMFFDFGWSPEAISENLRGVELKALELRKQVIIEQEFISVPMYEKDISFKEAPKLVNHPLQFVREMASNILGGST